jgi:hypothetical protein
MRAIVPLVVVATVIASVACSGKDRYRPGDALGTFQVDGALTLNECSAAGAVPNPWTFNVDLGRDPGVLYWIQGGAPVSGLIDPNGHATLSVTGTTEVRAATAKRKGCTIARIDSFDGTIAPTGPVTEFTGKLSYHYGVADGDCMDQLTENGGGFDALPCTIAYDVKGKQVAAPKSTK